MKLYYISLYYDSFRVTGANKRFDEVGRRLLGFYGDKFVCIVCEGNKPSWCPQENCQFVSSYHTKMQRLYSWVKLSLKLLTFEPGILISDFMPIPLFSRRHYLLQLIHDLRSFNSFSRGGLGRLTSGFQKRQLSKASRIITVSHFSAVELSELCGISPNSIFVSYNGIEALSLSCVHEGGRRDIDVIYVATFEDRKNHKTLLEALAGIETSLNVVLVGNDLGTENVIRGLALRQKKDKISFISNVSECELQDLYSRSKIFCSPSLYEGFGMPLIEAAQHGVRVCCSDISVFREILLDNARFFNPLSANELQTVLTKELGALSEGVELTPSLAESADFFEEKFSWDKISNEIRLELEKNGLLV